MRHVITVASFVVTGVAMLGLTVGALSPWMIDLLVGLDLGFWPEVTGVSMSLTVMLASAAVEVHRGVLGRRTLPLYLAITCALALVSVAIGGTRWTNAHRSREAAIKATETKAYAEVRAQHEEVRELLDKAKETRDKAMVNANGLLAAGLRDQRMSLRNDGLRIEERATAFYEMELKAIKAIPDIPKPVMHVPEVDLAKVAGPAVLEFAMAILIELLAAVWTATLFVYLSRRREELAAVEEAKAAEPAPEEEPQDPDVPLTETILAIFEKEGLDPNSRKDCGVVARILNVKRIPPPMDLTNLTYWRRDEIQKLLKETRNDQRTP